MQGLSYSKKKNLKAKKKLHVQKTKLKKKSESISKKLLKHKFRLEISIIKKKFQSGKTIDMIKKLKSGIIESDLESQIRTSKQLIREIQ